MPKTRSFWLYVIAAAGSALTILSLWLPWYGLNLPGSVTRVFSPGGPDAVNPFAKLGALMVAGLASLQFDAWRALRGWAAIIVVAALVAGVLALLAALGRARRMAPAIAGAAATALIYAAYRTLAPPGSSSLVVAKWGAFVGLGAAAATLTAALLAHREDQRAASPTLPAEPASAPRELSAPDHSAPHSVAPPGYLSPGVAPGR